MFNCEVNECKPLPDGVRVRKESDRALHKEQRWLGAVPGGGDLARHHAQGRAVQVDPRLTPG